MQIAFGEEPDMPNSSLRSTTAKSLIQRLNSKKDEPKPSVSEVFQRLFFICFYTLLNEYHSPKKEHIICVCICVCVCINGLLLVLGSF